MRRKSADRAAADAAIAARGNAPREPHDASRNMPLRPEIAHALAIIAKRNGKTLKQALADLAAAIPFPHYLEGLRKQYRDEADAELKSLFATPEPEA